MAQNITLTASLESIIGAAALPGYLSVTLCNFGTTPPNVPTVGMLADAGIPQLQGPATSFSIDLYGNDQITPAGTFYEITVFDGNMQPVQSGNYLLTGIETVDLSTLMPLTPAYNSPSNYLIFDPATGNITINDGGWNGPIVIDMTLTGNVTLTLVGFSRGQLVQFIIQQDGIGGHTVTWPGNVNNPAAVDPDSDSITTMQFVVRADGNLYPTLGWS